ncbi:hypothetical protein PMAYCL1PPCAC_23641 [Pristionchus mayeri]|uniref:PDZ domain-containing protein n=1 Tax=Pristionchus mayeri TaxID=1317129 RepID=A0AAN5I7R5_9BILA|nr:hypothetical protein PMAYCL1PPCAC_23641 [Pristionchus mayeri]
MSEQSGTIGCTLSMQEAHQFDVDRSLLPKEDNGRRTVIITRSNQNVPFGMVLQSDVIQTSEDGLKRYTYLDCVEWGGLAHKSGIRSGDILVAVNGVNVLSMSHSSLRSLLASTLEARIVVLAREHSRLIDLHSRRFLLRARLQQAEHLLLQITGEEEALLAKYRNRLRNSSVSLSSSPSPSRVSRGILLTKIDRIDSVVSPSSMHPQVTRL